MLKNHKCNYTPFFHFQDAATRFHTTTIPQLNTRDLKAYITFTVMHSLPLRFTLFLGLNLMIAHAQPDNLFLSEPIEPIEPTLSEQVDDISFSSDGFTPSLPDYALNQINNGDTDLFSDANAPVADMKLLDFATLPDSCGSEDSSTNDPLRARDGPSCVSPEEQINLPIGLFEDPEKYLRDNLLTPPVGQADQFGQGKESGDLGFGAFMRDRNPPIPKPLNQDEQICDREKYLLSTTPMCSNPFTGSIDKDPNLDGGFTLIDAVPCKCLFLFLFFFFFGMRFLLTFSEDDPALGCPEPSEVWCCAVIHIRARNYLVLDQSLV